MTDSRRTRTGNRTTTGNRTMIAFRPWRWAVALGLAVLLTMGLAACGSASPLGEKGGGTDSDELRVIAVTSYLADIAQNVAGDRLEVASLIPEGSDSHSFEPTPQDAKALAESNIVIRDSKGLTPLVDNLIAGSANEGQVVVEASAGLEGRLVEKKAHEDEPGGEGPHEHDTGGIDPHFWLDPVNIVTYAENVGKAFAAADPDGADVYEANVAAYGEQLHELDAWIVEQVAEIPPKHRLLVTNHEEFGYFADRYGFEVVGTVFPVVSEGAPSAQQLTNLVAEIQATGAPAIFLEAVRVPIWLRRWLGRRGLWLSVISICIL